MHNEFDGRDEVILIEYDGVIKNSNQFLLNKLGGELYDLYKDMLNLERVKGMNMDTCLTLAHLMMKSNIFDNFKKTELPEGWYVNYLDLYFNYPDMFSEATLLDMGTSLYSLLPQKFLKKIILWSRYDDPRIMEDMVMRYPDITKIIYSHGELSDVINQQEEKITMFIFADATHVADVIDYDKIEYTEIMIAKYRYNQRYEDGKLETIIDTDVMMENLIKLSEFVPATLIAKHYVELINKK